MSIDIAYRRLHNQRISHGKTAHPSQIVAWLGAMQAQDYASVKWAVGLRSSAASDALIEQAIKNKSIVRTWLLRGTLHMVAATDIRWMLALLAPRLITQRAGRHKQLELDDGDLIRSSEILINALQDHKQMTRAEVLRAVEQAGISTQGQRGYHILGYAALVGLICFGPPQEKKQTFVLLDEWVPQGQRLDRDEALSELAGRYFSSHGPATLQDFVWWSGLTKADARSGLEISKSQLHSAVMDGETYWYAQSDSTPEETRPMAYLLPAFDEYYLGYRMRDAVLDPSYDKKVVSSNGVFRPLIVVDGQIAGIWRRTLRKGSVSIALNPFKSFTDTENEALLAAARQFGAFHGLPTVVEQPK